MLTSKYVRSEFTKFQEITSATAELTCEKIAEAGRTIQSSAAAGGTVFFAGNGGSFAQALHFAAEFVGKFRMERGPLPAMALGDNTAALTAISNDFAYELAFSRQLEAFGKVGDVLILLSTSGNSESVIRAAQVARTRQIQTIGLTGQGGGRLATEVDVLVAVPSTDVARIQEMHQFIGHLLCGVSDMIGGVK